MKQLAFAVAVLAVGFTASTPARADYAVVRLDDGWCKIWWDSADNPWGVGWTKIAVWTAGLAHGVGDARDRSFARGVPLAPNRGEGAGRDCGFIGPADRWLSSRH